MDREILMCTGEVKILNQTELKEIKKNNLTVDEVQGRINKGWDFRKAIQLDFRYKTYNNQVCRVIELDDLYDVYIVKDHFNYLVKIGYTDTQLKKYYEQSKNILETIGDDENIFAVRNEVGDNTIHKAIKKERERKRKALEKEAKRHQAQNKHLFNGTPQKVIKSKWQQYLENQVKFL